MALIRERAIDRIWYGLLLLALVGAPISISRALVTGWLPLYSFHLGIGAAVVVAFALRRRMSVAARTTVVLIFFWLVGVVGITVLGPLGAGLWWLVSSVLIAGIMFSYRLAWILIAAVIFVVVATGYGYVNGYLVLSVDPVTYVRSPQAWATLLIAAAVLPLIVFQSIVVLLQGLRDLSDELQRAKDAVELEKEDAEQIAQAEGEAKRQAEADLRQAQRMLAESEKLAFLGRTVAGIAHDVNTPLGINVTAAGTLKNAIEELESALAEGRLSKEQFTDNLRTASQAADLIAQNTERAANLIRGYKTVAIDKASSASRHFELHTYVADVISSLSSELMSVDCRVENAVPEWIMMHTQAGALAQVLTDLILNALSHAFTAADRGHIEIGATQHGEEIELRVRDDGAGMAESVRAQVFESTSVIRKAEGGRGIGLHLVRKLVREALGGTIEVHSAPGEGAEFLIRMPRDFEPAAARGAGAETTA